MVNEVWKDIVGYEGLYQISNLGNVKSLGNNNSDGWNRERILKPRKRSGYLSICLCKDNKQKYLSIHRLVAEAFIPNPMNYLQVNHKDENKINNCVDNLEWCLNRYNVIYSIGRPVNQYDLNGNLIKTWKCVKDIELALGLSNQNIIKVCQNKRKKCGNYVWRYVEC